MPQHNITVRTDDTSLIERSAQLTIDGKPAFRLSRGDLLNLANETQAAIRALDWMWATYFYATDVNTTKQHLVRKEGSTANSGPGGNSSTDGTANELRQLPALCGRQPYAFPNPSPEDGWTLSPVFAHPHPNICSFCQRAYAKQQQQKREPGREEATTR